jgi:Putative phage serine protease XkdF
MTEKIIETAIIKAAKKQILYAVVSEPDTVDLHDDVIPADEIEKAAHEYLRNYRVIGVQHEKLADAEVVESFIAPVDYTADDGTLVKKGSWVMAVKVHSAALWAEIEKGAYTGFSIGGQAERVPA